MLDLSLLGCDINTHHSHGFSFKSNEAINAWLFMCFHTPFYYSVNNCDGSVITDGCGIPGDCLLHPIGTYISHGPLDSMEDGFVNDWIYFYGEDAQNITDILKIPKNTIFHTDDIREITSLLSNIIAQRDNYLPDSKFKISSYISQLLISIEGNKQVVKNNTKSYTDALFVREKMRKNYREKWTLAEMAELSHYSQSRFSTIYKQYFNVSPIDDLISFRVSKATDMLLCGERSIEQISEDCGFSSLQYFSRTYKRITGVSPSTIKKSM